MSRVGQSTVTGGRSFNVYDESAVMRRVVLPANATLNHIGVWGWESVTANVNNLRAAIYSSSGVLIYESGTLTGAVTGVGAGAVARYQIPFSGQALSAGTYDLMVSASGGASTFVVSGQTATGGTPISMFFTYLYPNAPADYTGIVDTTASRAWDIDLDYTEALAGGGVILGLLQNASGAFN